MRSKRSASVASPIRDPPLRSPGTAAGSANAGIVQPAGTAEELDRLRRVLRIRMAETDVAVAAQHELLAAELDLGLAGDRQERAVAAVIDQYVTIAPPFDLGVHPRRHPVGDHD